ncbi:hypothetical protein C1J05_14175 [Sulfitobacter sp. JL08]|nr:hypothetical protein C1J05_14175 [Sulfitobacter sp. JL08]
MPLRFEAATLSRMRSAVSRAFQCMCCVDPLKPPDETAIQPTRKQYSAEEKIRIVLDGLQSVFAPQSGRAQQSESRSAKKI